MARLTTRRWFPLVWAVPSAIAVLAVAVVLARWLHGLPQLAPFFAAYPGQSELPAGAPVGVPAWLSWQHYLNALFLGLLIRSGWRIRSKQRPPAFWTRDPRRMPGRLLGTRTPPRRLSIHVWWHLVVDTLFVANGVVYIVLLFATGQWVRIVPVHWDVLPNAVSVGIQYLSLDWPVSHGWTNYNALQLLTYFATVFLAAPLALLTGLRLSPAWPARWTSLNRRWSERTARRTHYAVLWYFIVFAVTHVTLVLATGTLRNLNHMYAGRDDDSWIGFGVFAASSALLVAAWVLARPAVLVRLAATSGTVRVMPPPPPR